MKISQYQKNYKKLSQLVGQDLGEFMKSNTYAKLKSSGWMDLSIDVLNNNMIAMAHNSVQNGDVMADPDMQVYIYPEYKIAFPVTYQNDFLGVFDQAYLIEKNEIKGKYPRLVNSLDSFFQTWLKNLKNQGHKIEVN